MTEENQAEFPQYQQYYYQPYAPQFYYNPQNFYQGHQSYYYQGGDSTYGYYNEQGDYPQGYQNQGVDPQNYNQNIGYREERPQSSRGRSQFRGKQGQGSRGGGHQSYGNQMKEEQKDNSESIESTENIPQSHRESTSRKYSENRNRGRGRGNSNQNYQGREFYSRNNSDRNRLGYTSGQNYSRNDRDYRNMDRNSRYENEENSPSYDQTSRNARGKMYSGRNQNYGGNQDHVRYQHRGGKSQSRHHGNDNSDDRDDGSRTNSNSFENYRDNRDNPKGDVRRQETKKFTGGSGGMNSPRHLETDSRSSFDKRNNPQKSRKDETETSKDKDKNVDKKYKFPSDRKLANKKQIEQVLAGKVDETQRGVLIEQFTRGTYECMVCCETVKCHHAVWNCPGCFHAFHLICIKKWAKSPAAVVDGEHSGWRCPACQKVTEKYPNQYLCFCNKIRDPEYDRMETPHSCGQVCRKNRGDNCSHPCNILCHPGPCPPCNAVVNRNCACGKESKSMKCSVTDVVKCEKVCGKALNCGKHFCKATCHDGSCQPCEEIIVKECYGSHTKKEVVCGCAESFTKSYCCGDLCKKTLECGNHQCDKVCHADDCKTCDTLPEVVTHCPCGATPLSDLSTVTRKSCTDPISTCEEICNKSLGCGPQDINVHKCKLKCHEDACGPCDGVTSLTCRCGAIDREIPCMEVHQYSEENPFTCDKRCNRKRTCGRHKCGQLCCVNEEHVCNQICGRKLSCGLHKCDEPCHRGNCPPCLMTGYDELTCHCGSEVMLPPIPCGTKAPICSNTCVRQHDCDHPVYHNCHSEEECPPCAVLTEKQCMGKHEIRKNIPCHQTNVSCGLPCNKVLPCQQHKCPKTCHAGNCQKEGEKCIQPCRIKRKDCNHPCGTPCHSGSPCPQSPCKAEVLLMCKCGTKEARVPCLSGVPQDTAEYQKITMQTLAGSLQSGQSVDMAQLSKKKKRQLDCDAECAVLERNRRMALALEIRNPDLSAKLGNPTYTDFLKDYAKSNAHFVSTVEKSLSDLVKSAKQSKHQHRSHSFSPGNRDQRRAIHELAEYYGCETQSYDFEPKKNVVATAYRDKCWLPSVSLTSHVQRELHPKPPVPIPHVHSEATLSQKAKAAKQSTEVLADAKPKSRWNLPDSKKKSSKPEIDYFDFSSN